MRTNQRFLILSVELKRRSRSLCHQFLGKTHVCWQTNATRLISKLYLLRNRIKMDLNNFSIIDHYQSTSKKPIYTLQKARISEKVFFVWCEDK